MRTGSLYIVGMLLAASTMPVSCRRPDVPEPIVPDGAVDMGIVMTREDDALREVGSSSNYWSSTADTEYPDYAWYFFTKKDRYVGEYHSARYYGQSVRPVAEL